jgi:hypothetical protein
LQFTQQEAPLVALLEPLVAVTGIAEAAAVLLFVTIAVAQ